MEEVVKALIERLVGKGMKIDTIPAYVRDLSNTIEALSDSNLDELNRKMELLGWNEIHLDDHTLQLILVSLDEGEMDGLCSDSCMTLKGVCHPEARSNLS